MINELKKQASSIHHTHIFKYLIVGVTAFVTEYGVFFLLYQTTHFQLYVANSLSFICGLIVSFIFNRLWTFREGVFTKSTSKQITIYVILATFNLLMINVIVGILKHLGIDPRVGKLVGQITVVTWNFIIYRKIVFTYEK